MRLFLCFSLFTLLLSGCLSDQDYINRRIASKQDVFLSYPEETRQRLQRGELRIGDDKNAAWFVYGKPSSVLSRLTAEGKTEIWVYTIQDIRSNVPEPILVSAPVRTASGRTVFIHDYYYAHTETRNEVEILRIEFTNDRVTLLEARENTD